MSFLKVEKLNYYYPETKSPALQDINLDVEEGAFLLVTGGSGSGKSSLARALAGLIPDFYGGSYGGRIFLAEQDIRFMKRRSLARKIGIVFQDPEKQLVMTSVAAEIAFGLENLGLPQAEMDRLIAEVMSFFGLTALQRAFSDTLSGGQKQKLALASVLAMQPQVLILDEPTSQLDPLAAEELFNLLKRLNEEFNFTIILIEQRLERCFHLVDRVVVMEGGRIVQDGPPAEVAAWEVQHDYPYVPTVASFFSHIAASEVPLTVKEGRSLIKNAGWLPQDSRNDTISVIPLAFKSASNQPADTIHISKGDDENLPGSPGLVGQSKNFIHWLSRSTETQPCQADHMLMEVKNLWFTYPNGREALRGIDLSVHAGEYVAILGENGSGKTTLLKQMAGLLQPGRGQVMINGFKTDAISSAQRSSTVGYLSQNPNDYLFNDTVEEELRFTLDNLGQVEGTRIGDLLAALSLSDYRHVNPRDLSSGQRQRVALASVLIGNPRLLLLDEPTRGIDYCLKAQLGNLLQVTAAHGVAVIVVTHDVDFAAEYAERVVMMFDGRISCAGPKNQVLGNSIFYAPQIRKLFKGIDDELYTFRDAVNRAKGASLAL